MRTAHVADRRAEEHFGNPAQRHCETRGAAIGRSGSDRREPEESKRLLGTRARLGDGNRVRGRVCRQRRIESSAATQCVPRECGREKSQRRECRRVAAWREFCWDAVQLQGWRRGVQPSRWTKPARQSAQNVGWAVWHGTRRRNAWMHGAWRAKGGGVSTARGANERHARGTCRRKRNARRAFCMQGSAGRAAVDRTGKIGITQCLGIDTMGGKRGGEEGEGVQRRREEWKK